MPKKIAVPTVTSTALPADVEFSIGDINKVLLKDLISSFYQVQKVRIQVGNKLVAHFHRKLGISAVETLIAQHQSDKKTEIDLMSALKYEFGRLADALSTDKLIRESTFKKLTQDNKGVFSEYIEFSWMQQYRQILASENAILKDIESTLNKFTVWTNFLSGIKGVGPTIGGVIISCIDIHKAETPASLFKYAGLDVVLTKLDGSVDGRGRGKFKDHLVEVEYTAADGSVKQRDSVTFNPFLKTKLVGVLSDIMIKHRTPKYRDEYDNYKNRITLREDVLLEQSKHDIDYNNRLQQITDGFDASSTVSGKLKGVALKRELDAAKVIRDTAIAALDKELYVKRTPAHLHKMAIRYMIKRFLVDLYIEWRTIEGLPVTEEYAIRKLGMVHHTSSKFGVRSQANTHSEPEETPLAF